MDDYWIADIWGGGGGKTLYSPFSSLCFTPLRPSPTLFLPRHVLTFVFLTLKGPLMPGSMKITCAK